MKGGNKIENVGNAQGSWEPNGAEGGRWILRSSSLVLGRDRTRGQRFVQLQERFKLDSRKQTLVEGSDALEEVWFLLK